MSGTIFFRTLEDEQFLFATKYTVWTNLGGRAVVVTLLDRVILKKSGEKLISVDYLAQVCETSNGGVALECNDYSILEADLPRDLVNFLKEHLKEQSAF